MDLFDQLTRGFIGADRFIDAQREFASAAKKLSAFPFYNIKKVEDNRYVIQLAVAGYTLGDLDITLDKDKLIISSNGVDESTENYIYKGFASRKFSRSFTLMDNIKVTNAELINGILSVWLEEFVRDEDKPKKINIKSPTQSAHPQLLNEESNI